jgi:hypothetical protein
MTSSLLRRLQELADGCAGDWLCSRATKEANLAGCLSECNPIGDALHECLAYVIGREDALGRIDGEPAYI